MADIELELRFTYSFDDQDMGIVAGVVVHRQTNGRNGHAGSIVGDGARWKDRLG